MICDKCKEDYDIQSFNSFRVYEDDYLVKKFDLCNHCYDKFLNNDKLEELTDKLIENGYNLYKISQCSNYNDCKKIDNLRKMCETAEDINQSPMFNPISLTRAVNWCNPADAGLIKATVRLYELFDNYDKSSTKLNKNMLKYTKNMRNLTWWILGFTIVSAVLTFINLGIALS